LREVLVVDLVAFLQALQDTSLGRIIGTFASQR
jgi:hypothetical protein